MTILQPAHIPRALVAAAADGAWVVPGGTKLTDEQFASSVASTSPRRAPAEGATFKVALPADPECRPV
jgi:hypothetical protein